MSYPPKTIGRYQVQQELGRGMMGVVYHAHDPDLGRDIALKVIQFPGGAAQSEVTGFEQRFFAEARSAARLSHPGIVVVHDVGRDGSTGAPFMALQLVPGKTLDNILRDRKRLPVHEAVFMARRLAEALHHAHSQGVVHRDIKPANIMVLPTGEPMIMDFGIAKMESARLTATGHFVGTPLYMSPEQALAKKVDGRSDIFSLGSVLYESLTGVPAFAGESVTRILFQLISQEPAPPSTLVSSLTASVDYILSRCLAKDIEKRYQSALELADDLGDVLEGRAPRSLIRPPITPGLAATITVGTPVPVPAALSGPTPPAAVTKVAGIWTGRENLPPAPWLAGLGIAVSAAIVLWAMEPLQTAPPTASATVETSPVPAAPLQASPSSDAEPDATPAHLVIDFEHTLRRGVLRIYIDDEKVVEEAISGRLTRKVVGIEFRKGRQAETLAVAPGRRRVRVQVAWDNNVKTEETRGLFTSGKSRRLKAKLGSLGGLRKDLSLTWANEPEKAA